MMTTHVTMTENISNRNRCISTSLGP